MTQSQKNLQKQLDCILKKIKKTTILKGLNYFLCSGKMPWMKMGKMKRRDENKVRDDQGTCQCPGIRGNSEASQQTCTLWREAEEGPCSVQTGLTHG
jgi:hypothetical protein